MPQRSNSEFPTNNPALHSDDPTDGPSLPDDPVPGVPEPLWPRVSGLYVERWRGHGPAVINELRLDVDRSYRQMTASGNLLVDGANRPHWIADVSLVAPGVYEGTIWYVYPVFSFFLRHVRIEVTNAPDSHRGAVVTFSNPGYQPITHRFRFESIYFHQVQFEYDAVAGAHPVLSLQTGAHPNRPAGLVNENLTVDTVFRRAGIDVVRNNREDIIPIASAGTDLVWNSIELHDAMVVYWSHYSTQPQWAVWTLFAGLSELGTGLGGTMFDIMSGSPQRRGCVIFTESFPNYIPAGDPAPAAWVERMRFWTACHEIGHTFNLVHSYQKHSASGPFVYSWIPLVDDFESRSFMNYPQFPAGGETAYFHSFYYRFSDDELLFMRHAPERFVEMGGAAFGNNHAFQNLAADPEPALRLELRLDRARATFEFMEPVVAELRLTNVSAEPLLVDENILNDTHDITLLVGGKGGALRAWRPYTTDCRRPVKRVLAPGESIAAAYFISADTNGWSITEPGYYSVQAGLECGDDYVVSNALEIRVAPSHGYDEEYFAQDLWADSVGRALAFDGSRVMIDANALLRDAVQRFAARRIAIHAAVALAMPLRRDGRVLAIKGEERTFDVVKADTKQAAQLLTTALLKDPAAAAETLGHIDYRYYMNELIALLKGMGREREAADAGATLEKTLGPTKPAGTKG